jgi:hypothetical protein
VELRDELGVLGSDGDVVERRHTRLKRGIRGSQIPRGKRELHLGDEETS